MGRFRRSSFVALVGAFVGALLSAPAGARAEDGFTDAEALALELGGEPLAPPDLVTLVDQHLSLLRPVNPYLADVTVALDWAPGRIWVGMTPEAFAELQAGTYAGFDVLNATYGPVTMVPDVMFHDVFLTFETPYNSQVMASLYGAAPGVAYADPDYYQWAGLFEDISSNEVGTYTFRYIFNCDFIQCYWFCEWTYRVTDAGEVVLLAATGHSPTDAPLAAPSGTDLRVWPNPTVGATQLAFSLAKPSRTELAVHDVTGRLVRRMESGVLPAGRVVRSWDARDQAGRSVAGGTYFVLLKTDEATQTRRVVVAR